MPPCLVTLRPATDRGLAYLASRVAVQCRISRCHSIRRSQSTTPEHRPTYDGPDAAGENDFLDFILDNTKYARANGPSQSRSVHDAPSAASPRKRAKTTKGFGEGGVYQSSSQLRTEAAKGIFSQVQHRQDQSNADLPALAVSSKRTRSDTRRSDRYTTGRRYANSLRQARLVSRRRKFFSALRSQPLAGKLVPLKSMSRRSDVFLSLWNVNFARLSARYDRHHKVRTLEDKSLVYLEPISPFLDPRTPNIVEKALEYAGGQTGSLSLDALGEIAGGRSPVIVWAEITLWLLSNDPTRAPDFLLATHLGPAYPPLKWVEDAIEYLARHFQYSNIPEKEAQIATLVSMLTVLSERADGEHMKIRGSTIRHLLRHSSPEGTVELYRAIANRDLGLHPLTYTHFATTFAQQGDLEQAISALLEAHAKGCHLQTYPFLSTCATLLRASMEQPGGLRMCLRLIDNLVEIGVKLNTHLTNIIMLNAIDAGECDTAMSIFSSMTSNGVQPDAYTFAILLKLCKTDIDNAATLRDTIQLAVEQSDVRGNPVLATEILHCLALHHSKHNPKNAFKTLADAYVGLFNPQALETLGIDMPKTNAAVDETGALSSNLLSPSPQALSVLLSVYLRHARVEEARRLYLQWREMVKAGDARMRELASTTHLANAFVKAFIARKDTLLVAAEVIKNMQKHANILSKDNSKPQLATGSNRTSTSAAAPDVYTFSIFLEGLLKHGQDELAQQTLAHMRKQGIEPTTVTWNIVVSGYAGIQKLNRVYEGIRELWQSGRAFDEWTYKGLSKLTEKNRNKLQAKLAKLELDKRMDFTEELKQGLSNRLQQAAQGETNRTEETVS